MQLTSKPTAGGTIEYVFTPENERDDILILALSARLPELPHHRQSAHVNTAYIIPPPNGPRDDSSFVVALTGRSIR